MEPKKNPSKCLGPTRPAPIAVLILVPRVRVNRMSVTEIEPNSKIFTMRSWLNLF